MEMTEDYQFSFFRKPIHNTEPIRAVGIVDIYRYIVGHYAEPQTKALRMLEDKRKPSCTRQRTLTSVVFPGCSESDANGNC